MHMAMIELKKSVVKLLNIFNYCLQLIYFPRSWSKSIIIVIPKAGKNYVLPENHRPISLLPQMEKLPEKLFLNKLNEVFEQLKILPEKVFRLSSKPLQLQPYLVQEALVLRTHPQIMHLWY